MRLDPSNFLEYWGAEFMPLIARLYPGAERHSGIIPNTEFRSGSKAVDRYGNERRYKMTNGGLEQQLLTIREAAQLLSCSKAHLSNVHYLAAKLFLYCAAAKGLGRNLYGIILRD
jgi:hypothetical protein